MSASLPDTVRVAVPSAPALMVAAPASVTVSVPFTTVNWVLARFPSTSVTLMVFAPVNASAVSSFTVCAPGTVFTGASFTAVTVMATGSVSESGVPALSVESTVRVSAPL